MLLTTLYKNIIFQAETSNDSRTEFFNSFKTSNSSDSNILDGILISQNSHNFCIDSENTKNVFIFNNFIVFKVLTFI
jgi:hypothetical protein